MYITPQKEHLQSSRHFYANSVLKKTSLPLMGTKATISSEWWVHPQKHPCTYTLLGLVFDRISYCMHILVMNI